MLRMEDRVDRGEPYVLIRTAVTGDVMRVKQLVVIEACSRRISDEVVYVRLQTARGIGAVGDVDQKLMAGADRVREVDRRQRIALDKNLIARVGESIGALHHDHRKAVWAL